MAYFCTMAKKGITKNSKNKELHTQLIKRKKDKKREKQETRKERLKEIIKLSKNV